MNGVLTKGLQKCPGNLVREEYVYKMPPLSCLKKKGGGGGGDSLLGILQSQFTKEGKHKFENKISFVLSYEPVHKRKRGCMGTRP